MLIASWAFRAMLQRTFRSELRAWVYASLGNNVTCPYNLQEIMHEWNGERMREHDARSTNTHQDAKGELRAILKARWRSGMQGLWFSQQLISCSAVVFVKKRTAKRWCPTAKDNIGCGTTIGYYRLNEHCDVAHTCFVSGLAEDMHMNKKSIVMTGLL